MIPLESPRAPRRIFVHFLDHEIFYTFKLNRMNQQRVESDLRFAFRVALLLAEDSVILPASHFFESPFARLLLQQHSIFADFGYINLASNTLNIDEFLQQKQQQYNVERSRYPLYFEATSSSIQFESSARWILKNRNSTKDITSDWMNSIGDAQTWESIYSYSRSPLVSAFEKDLEQVPEKLQANAFIADFVVPLLPIKEEVQKFAENHINILIQRAYIDSFLKTYDAACLDDFSTFDTSVLLQADRPCYSVSKAKRYFLMKNQLLDFVMFATASQLLHYKVSEQWRSQLDTFIAYVKKNDNIKTSEPQVTTQEEVVNQVPISQENNSLPLPMDLPTQQPIHPVPIAPTYPDNLTKREVEVLSLVAKGLTDAHVAEVLVISHRTVHAHLSSIYNKLDISSRSAATHYAFEHGLV